MSSASGPMSPRRAWMRLRLPSATRWLSPSAASRSSATQRPKSAPAGAIAAGTRATPPTSRPSPPASPTSCSILPSGGTRARSPRCRPTSICPPSASGNAQPAPPAWPTSSPGRSGSLSLRRPATSPCATNRRPSRPLGIDTAAIATLIDTGAAHARLAADHAAADKARIEGSPTLVLNEGRQKLYGNVGFRVIEANIRELLRDPSPDQASWC